MKKIITICAAILMTVSVFAQSPEKMSYQAVVRDGSNNLVTSTSVGIQVSILQGSASGTAVYVETQTPTSNANGLVSIEIGNGIIVSGTFASIDWANGPYFIKTEMDPTGGVNYTISGTSQLLSVPYALYSKKSGSVKIPELSSSLYNYVIQSPTQVQISLDPSISEKIRYSTMYTDLFIYDNSLNIITGTTIQYGYPISNVWNFDPSLFPPGGTKGELYFETIDGPYKIPVNW